MAESVEEARKIVIAVYGYAETHIYDPKDELWHPRIKPSLGFL